METQHNKMDRRAFLKTTGIGGVSLALSTGLTGGTLMAEVDKDNVSKKMPTRILGKTGVPLSILGMGGSVDTTGYLTLLRIGLNMGVNYWDSAHSYGNGKNEEVIGQFYRKYPEERKKVFQVTKASRTTEPKGMTQQLQTSLERMQTDYIDLYFIHMLQDPDLLTPEIKAWAEEKKKEGKIRFFGFSCHANMAPMLMRASSLGWIDAIQFSYNYQLKEDDDIQKAIDACTKAGVGLVAMKTQGQRLGPPPNPSRGREGTPPDSQGPPQGEESPPSPPSGPPAQGSDTEPEDLTALSHFMDKGYTPHQARLKAIWGDSRITTCLSEMTNLTMLKENVTAATDGVNLSEKDRDMLKRIAWTNRGLYCKGCMQCESVMVTTHRIPDVLRYMMYYHSYGKKDDARRLFGELPGAVKKALANSDFSPAEKACPNQIQIGTAMREAVRLLG